MNGFLQLHFLTNYPISNPNRDDLGRPKTAIVGGSTRLRISSQALKRAWRTSVIQEAMGDDRMGARTRMIADGIMARLLEAGVSEKEATEAAKSIGSVFGKLDSKGKKPWHIAQLAHVSPDEREAINALVAHLVSESRGPKKEELALLRSENRAADIALFGRMLAADAEYNVEAAAQVSHAFSVHAITVEDDYFSAVDDLKPAEDDAGAGHIGEAYFSSGLMYTYVCINRQLLAENLASDEDAITPAIEAFVEAACTIAPGGKQNSYASRVRSSYVCAQLGTTQPTSLACAFLDPIDAYEARSSHWLPTAVGRLRNRRDAFAKCYGQTGLQYELSVPEGKGTLEALKKFCSGPLDA